MVKFEAVLNGEVVAEGSTMQQAVENAKKAGYRVEEIKLRSIRESPRV